MQPSYWYEKAAEQGAADAKKALANLDLQQTKSNNIVSNINDDNAYSNDPNKETSLIWYLVGTVIFGLIFPPISIVFVVVYFYKLSKGVSLWG